MLWEGRLVETKGWDRGQLDQSGSGGERSSIGGVTHMSSTGAALGRQAYTRRHKGVVLPLVN